MYTTRAVVCHTLTRVMTYFISHNKHPIYHPDTVYITPPAVSCPIIIKTLPKNMETCSPGLQGGHGNDLPTGRLWSTSTAHAWPDQDDPTPNRNPSQFFGRPDVSRCSRATP